MALTRISGAAVCRQVLPPALNRFALAEPIADKCASKACIRAAAGLNGRMPPCLFFNDGKQQILPLSLPRIGRAESSSGYHFLTEGIVRVSAKLTPDTRPARQARRLYLHRR